MEDDRFKQVVEKMADEILEEYANIGEEITMETVRDFVEDKKTYLENFDEWDYAQSVWERIDMLMLGMDYEEYWKHKGGTPSPPKETTILEPESEKKPQKPQRKTTKTTSKTQNKEIKQVKLWDFRCNASMLKEISTKSQAVNTEIPVYVKKDGIHIKSVDPSHVSMVEIDIPYKNFCTGHDCVNQEITYTLAKDFEFGLDLESLDKTLRLFNMTDKIHGYIENNQLHLIREEKEEIHKQLNLIDIEGWPEPKIPAMDFSVNAKIRSSGFATLKKALEGEEYVVFIADDDLKAIVGDDEPLKMMLSQKEDVTGKGKALYSSDYLQRIINTFGGSFYYSIDTAFDTDSPIRLEGKIGNKDGRFTYLLAPRIESE